MGISFIPFVKVMGLLLSPIKSPSLHALESGYNTVAHSDASGIYRLGGRPWGGKQD